MCDCDDETAWSNSDDELSLPQRDWTETALTVDRLFVSTIVAFYPPPLLILWDYPIMM